MNDLLDENTGKINLRRALTGWPMIIAWIAMLIFAIHASTHMVAAGDTWVAMACGRHFVQHGVDTVEPFSANSHKAGPTPESMQKFADNLKDEAGDKEGIKYSLMRWWAGKCEDFENWPEWQQDFAKWIHPTGWINQNWLTHVIFYKLVPPSTYTPSDTFTSNALVYWKFVLYIVAVICVYYTTRLLGVNPMLAAAFTCFAIFTGRSYFDVRPAGFSNMLVALFLLVLVLATYKNILFIWLVVPITVFWCNVHGGYLYVFIMLAPFVILHLLALFPKKWTITSYAILMWGGLYVLAQRFFSQLESMTEEYFKPFVPAQAYVNSYTFSSMPISKDPAVYVILILAAVAVIVTLLKNKKEVFYTFHVIALITMFFTILAKYFPGLPAGLVDLSNERVKDIFYGYLTSSVLMYILIFIVACAAGCILVFFKKHLISLSFKSLLHTVGAGAAAFVAMIIINPFHLTNLTHTFIISISKHAEMWRTINEWHPAFEFSNPVGTSYPFLVMFIFAIVVPAFWLGARLLRPNLEKLKKADIKPYKQSFEMFLKIFAFLAAAVFTYITLVGFAFINYDFVSFICAALFAVIILLAVYKNVSYIFLLIPFTFFALWIINPDCITKPLWFTSTNSRYYGRYIYPVIAIPFFLIFHLIASQLSKKVQDKPVNIALVAGSAVITFVLMLILFNPFRFEIPESAFGRFIALKEISRARMVYRPTFTANAEPNYTFLFPILYIINLLAVVIYLAVPYIKNAMLQTSENSPQAQEVSDEQKQKYALPKIDLGLMAIAVLTIYMGLKMRRFIPVAAIAACPVIAMFSERTILLLNASINYYRTKKFFVSPMPQYLKHFFIISAAAVTGFLGIFWGLQFKTVYLDPWPTHIKFTSMFMRMTASDSKPFEAVKFIKDNDISGRMFNYWTEGGFIAWGQVPDPNTGKTPLRLFMDGRAQAAYEPAAYNKWANIMAGGPVVREARSKGEKPDFVEAGKWIYEQLTKENVWLILMPITEFDGEFVTAIETNSDWQIIFYNNKQKMYVDKNSQKGIELLNGICEVTETENQIEVDFCISGRTAIIQKNDPNAQVFLDSMSLTKYPEEFSENLILGHYKLLSPSLERRKQGIEHVKAACDIYPSGAPIHKLLYAASRHPELDADVYEFCKSYFEDFNNNKEMYKKQNGYHDRIVVALYTLNYFIGKEGNKELIEEYEKQKKDLEDERLKLLKSKRW